MFVQLPVDTLCKMCYWLFEKDQPSPELQSRAEEPARFDGVCTTAQLLRACPCAGFLGPVSCSRCIIPAPPHTQPVPTSPARLCSAILTSSSPVFPNQPRVNKDTYVTRLWPETAQSQHQ